MVVYLSLRSSPVFYNLQSSNHQCPFSLYPPSIAISQPATHHHFNTSIKPSSPRYRDFRAMGLSPKLRQKSSADAESMGLLFVFFPDEDENDRDPPTAPNTTTSPPHASNLLSRSPSSLSSSSSAKSITGSASYRRINSTRLITKAQSTISICALLVFITLLVFTLSTFEPTTAAKTHLPVTPRRFLSQKKTDSSSRRSALPNSFHFSNFWSSANNDGKPKHQFALQGMGTLYRRGTRAMNDLIVGHVVETTTDEDIRVFMRALLLSGSTAKADLVLIFCSSSSNLSSIVQEENDAFSRLLQWKFNGSSDSKSRSPSNFDASQFVKSSKSKEKEVAEPIWGKKNRSNYSDGGTESTRLNYGSVVSFDAQELDSENSLAGFLDHIPMSLRRWACYPMLLGRLRRNFKHVMLVDVKNSVVLSDPLGRLRSRSAESVQLLIKPDSGGKHSKKNSDKTQGHSSVNSAMIMGGARGVRRLASAMLTEIVRFIMQHKKKSSVTESVVLNQLVGNDFMLKSVDLIIAADSAPDLNSLVLNAASPLPDYAIVHRGINRHDLTALIMKQICSHEYDSSVYKDC